MYFFTGGFKPVTDCLLLKVLGIDRYHMSFITQISKTKGPSAIGNP